MVGVLGKPWTVWLEYWVNPGLCGWSIDLPLDCVVGVMDGRRTVCLEYWLDKEKCACYQN